VLTINNNDITDIYLLSVEEAVKIPLWIRVHRDYWWLRSPGGGAFVGGIGSVVPGGYGFVYYKSLAIRPALKISNLESADLQIGETVNVLGLMTQYIGDDSVLLSEPIGYCRFDEVSGEYDTSGIKEWLNAWLAERMANDERTNDQRC